MTLGDVNRDGRLDVIAGAYQPGDPENVFVMVGRGNGRFDPAQPLSNGSGAAVLGIAVGDVNADGNPDIVSNTFTSLSVLPGNGDGTFATPVLSGAGAGDQRSTLLGDLTGDGLHPGLDPDRRHERARRGPRRPHRRRSARRRPRRHQGNAHRADRPVPVRQLRRAGAGFGPPLDLPTGHDPVSVTTADFSGDGRPDIVELLSARAPSTFAVVMNATP